MAIATVPVRSELHYGMLLVSMLLFFESLFKRWSMYLRKLQKRIYFLTDCLLHLVGRSKLILLLPKCWKIIIMKILFFIEKIEIGELNSNPHRVSCDYTTDYELNNRLTLTMSNHSTIFLKQSWLITTRIGICGVSCLPISWKHSIIKNIKYYQLPFPLLKRTSKTSTGSNAAKNGLFFF